MRISGTPFTTTGSQNVRQTQPTPPWFELYGTTKFDAFQIARVRLVDSMTVADLMGRMHHARRVIPKLPPIGEHLLDDVSLYGKSTIIGQGGSWDLAVHVRSLKPNEHTQHFDLKMIGNSYTQDISFDATFRTTSIDGVTVQGSSKGRGTWRAVNMILEPYEALGTHPDGNRPLEVSWNIESTGWLEAHNKAQMSIDSTRTVYLDQFETQHQHGTMNLDGTLGGVDTYRSWPQLMRATVSNATVPLLGQNRTINHLEAQCDRFACQASAVADDGANTATFDVVPQAFGLKVVPKDVDTWSVMSSTGQCRGFCDDTVFVVQPFVCHEDHPDTFANLATNIYRTTLNETWCMHVHNNYGHADVVVNATSRSIDKLTANVDVQDVEEPLFAIGSLSIDANDNNFMVEAQDLAIMSMSHVGALSLTGTMDDLEHGTWSLLARDVTYGSYRPLMVMAHGDAAFEEHETRIVSDFGYMSTDVAHVEWAKDGMVARYNLETFATKFNLDGAFGEATVLSSEGVTGRLFVDVDATLESFPGLVGLDDLDHYVFDVQDDAATLFALVPEQYAAYLPNGTRVEGAMRIKAWGDNGELPQAVITLDDGTVDVPLYARVYQTTAKLEIPGGDYEIAGRYQSPTANAEFESVGWFAWRRGAARFTSDSYYVSDTGTETEFSGELVWKPGKKIFPSL
jgi:hypothetical protein